MKKTKQQIKIGILQLTPGWCLLLDQLGVPYQETGSADVLLPETFSALIVNTLPDKTTVSRISKYLQSGGAVLSAGYLFSPFQKKGLFGKKVNHLFPDVNEPVFNTIRPLDIYTRISRCKGSRHLNHAVCLQKAGNGFGAYLPFNPEQLLLNEEKIRKKFYHPRKTYPNEVVSRISKNEIRKVIDQMLKWLHFKRKLPYVHLHYFPEHYRNIFMFRIDSDYASRDQVEQLYTLADSHPMKMTWFLHGNAHEQWFSRFGEFKDQEFGVHGYKHFTYETYTQNHENIQKCIRLFKQHHISFNGFSAPYALWNRALARAVEDLGFSYGSEFALDYDNLPFYPYVKNRFSTVLQVPVHPICIGSLKRMQLEKKDMILYYQSVISEKLRFDEPLAFYDHPGHPFLDVWRALFSEIGELKIPNLTMGAYASWWKKRNHTTMNIETDTEGVTVYLHDHDPSVSLRVWHPFEEKHYSFIDTSGYASYKDLDFVKQDVAFPLAAGYNDIRKWSPKLRYYDYLEKKWRKED